MDTNAAAQYKMANPNQSVRNLRIILLSVTLLCAAIADATPVNKAALQRHFGQFLGKDLDRCTTCHLPSANKAPESLDEFPHNEFGKRLRALGKSKMISERLALIAKEDADGDGVNNE